MKKWTKLAALALGAILTVGVIAGCGQDQKAAAPAGEKKLVVAGSTTWPPFEFAEGDKYVGFDVDLANLLGKKIGYKVEYKSMGFDALIPALQTKQIDAIFSGMSITEKRKEVISFTDPYYMEKTVAVVKVSNDSIQNLQGLASKPVGAQIGTTQVGIAEKAGASTVKQFDNVPNMLDDIQNGGVQAGLIADSVAKYYIKVGGKKDLKIVDIGTTDNSEIGIGVNKENKELLDKLNKALAEVKASGEFKALEDKWLGQVK